MTMIAQKFRIEIIKLIGSRAGYYDDKTEWLFLKFLTLKKNCNFYDSK